MTAFLRTGRDVVLPQLIVTPTQAERFEAAAAEAGAAYVGVLLEGRRQLLDLAPQHGWTVVDASEAEPALAALARAVRQ